jgi:RNA polymerase sigma factor (TIGR02999 family)
MNPFSLRCEPQSVDTPVHDGEITRLLKSWRRGDPNSLNEVIPLVYKELRKGAQYYMNQEAADHSLPPTALANEVVLQLFDGVPPRFENRAMFFGFAGKLMRHLLVKHARKKRARKRGGDMDAVPYDDGLIGLPITRDTTKLLALDEALSELNCLDKRKTQIVELRFFAGMNVAEVAAALRISPTTVKSEWRAAKHWLAHRLGTLSENSNL